MAKEDKDGKDYRF